MSELKHRERPQSEASSSNVSITKAFPDARPWPRPHIPERLGREEVQREGKNSTEAAETERCTSE